VAALAAASKQDRARIAELTSLLAAGGAELAQERQARQEAADSLKGPAGGALALHAVRLETQLADERARASGLERQLAAQAEAAKAAQSEFAHQEENRELELARMGSLLNAEQRASSALRGELQALRARTEQHERELEAAALPAKQLAEQVERVQAQLQEARDNSRGLELRLQAKQAQEGSFQDNLVAEISRLGAVLAEEQSRRQKAEHQLVLESSDV
jgi:chromosome segregation ATPase